MNVAVFLPDQAAVFGCALSLLHACHEEASRRSNINLSEAYNGGDQLMREVMRVGSVFETWACEHVLFNELNDVWPYLLEDKFGNACIETVGVTELASFHERDCFLVARKLKLPVEFSGAR